MKTWTIGAGEQNQRLDKYLKKLLPNAGSGFLYKMLRKKNITLDGKKATGSEMLSAGMEVALYFSDETYEKFAGTKGAEEEQMRLLALPMAGLSVIYEDEEILLANKPAGMLSQKAKAGDVSANEYLLGYLLREGAWTGTFRPSVCNRLDRNTTGLLLMGKTLSGAQMLSEGLRTRAIKKYYCALVCGRAQAAHLSGWLIKDEAANTVRIIESKRPGASQVETAYRPVKSGDGWTLLEIELITGKTHQIRAHLASVGHPVIGDFKYGNEPTNQYFRRSCGICSQLLHAMRIELPDGRKFTAPLPRTFAAVMERERTD